MEKREELINVSGNIEEANEILADGSDPEMVEMAKMQLDEAKERLPECHGWRRRNELHHALRGKQQVPGLMGINGSPNGKALMDYQRIRHIQLSDGSNLGTILFEHIHFLLMSCLFKGF
jgi:hypothetical protein